MTQNVFNTEVNIVKASMHRGRGCPLHKVLTSSPRAGQINCPAPKVKARICIKLGELEIPQAQHFNIKLGELEMPQQGQDKSTVPPRVKNIDTSPAYTSSWAGSITTVIPPATQCRACSTQ
jgi:hypothetical protein